VVKILPCISGTPVESVQSKRVIFSIINLFFHANIFSSCTNIKKSFAFESNIRIKSILLSG
jgi:hypothetical protein